MDTGYLLSLLQECLYLIIVFFSFLGIGLWRGRYTLVNLILALDLALLFTLKFPYFESLLRDGETSANALIQIALFIGFTTVGVFLFRRHIPGDDYEKAFEGFWKKLLLAAGATVLIMAFSYHVLPVTEFIHPGTPIQTVFAPDTYFFWWLLAPLVILFIV
jgi:hypothetical protein